MGVRAYRPPHPSFASSIFVLFLWNVEYKKTILTYKNNKKANATQKVGEQGGKSGYWK